MEIKSAYETATANGRTERIIWSEHELIELAKAFIEERKADPLSPAHEILSIGMRKVLPTHRHRDIVSMNAVLNVRSKIENLWLEEMTKTTPEPIVCHVETQAPADYIDILHRCDLPSLVALVVAKLGESAAALKPLLSAMNGAPATNGSVGAPHVAPVSLLAQASAKPRKTRVLIVGPDNRQFAELENDAKDLPVELLLLERDKRDKHANIHCDHVIATFVNKNLNDRLRENVPAGRYHLLQGTGISNFLNKLRDIGSLLPQRS